MRESGPFAENRPFARRDVIDPWRQERKGEPKRNAAKLAEKTPQTRDAERIVSASTANSHGPGSLKIGQLPKNHCFECGAKLSHERSIVVNGLLLFEAKCACR